MGVENIITFDAHDPRVQNADPAPRIRDGTAFLPVHQKPAPQSKGSVHRFRSYDGDQPGRRRHEPRDLHRQCPGLDMGMFYKRRDYTCVVNGRNPIVAHEFLGSDVKGKDMIIIDDMISSGESALEVAAALKKRNARKIFICSTFGLFTNGLEIFDDAYQKGIIDRVLTTNLIYQSPELLERDWYVNCNMSKYVAYLIDTLNHDTSISDLLDPNDKIQNLLAKYRKN